MFPPRPGDSRSRLAAVARDHRSAPGTERTTRRALMTRYRGRQELEAEWSAGDARRAGSGDGPRYLSRWRSGAPLLGRRLRGPAQSATSSRPRAADRPRRGTRPVGWRLVWGVRSADAAT